MEDAHFLDANEVLERLGVDVKVGLNDDGVAASRAKFGPNGTGYCRTTFRTNIVYFFFRNASTRR